MGVAHATAAAGGNHFATWFSATTAALAALTGGDGDTALRWSSVSLVALDQAGDREVPLQLELRGNALTLLGRCVEALQCYSAAHTHNLRAGVPWPGIPATAVLLERAKAGTPAHVGQRAWEDGALLTLHDVAVVV
jgi:hypothetical protein